MKIYHVIKIEEIETSKISEEYFDFSIGKMQKIMKKEQKEIDLGFYTEKALVEKIANGVATTYEDYILLTTINCNLQIILQNCNSNMISLKNKISEINDFCVANIELVINEMLNDILSWFEKENYICKEYNLTTADEFQGENL